MSFNQQILDRISEQYNKMEDFGPGPLYIAIAELIAQGNHILAHNMAAQAGAIHLNDDPFIVEGTTTNNQVFVEVVRRAAFEDAAQAELPYRTFIMRFAEFISDFGVRILQSDLSHVQAANDDNT